MDIEQIDLEDLKSRLGSEVKHDEEKVLKLPEKHLPKVVKRLRAARLERRIRQARVLKNTKRSGKTHYKARRKQARIEYWKWERPSQLRYKKKLVEVPELRYKEVVRKYWKKRLTEEQLANVMSVEQYVQLMNHVPEKLYELTPGVIPDSRYRNLEQYVRDNTLYSNAYPNVDNTKVINTFHKIVRLDTSKSYTLDNVLVIDLYTNLVLYKPSN